MSLRARIAQSLLHAYVSIDPRTLGLFRICLGSMLLLDLSFRIPVVEHFYSNDGLLPNHTLLWAPPTPRMVSFFYTLSTPEAAAVGMAICGVVFAFLLVGYRTKLFQILSFICLVSLNTRTSVLENGGDMVMNILTTFTLFLPLGKRFSLDALLASLRAREEHVPEELYDRAGMRIPVKRVLSLAVLALVLQLGCIYFFNVVHKTGHTWLSDLSAVHLTLHQDRIITTLGVWLRENLSVEILKALTMTTIVVESVGAFLVLSPFFPAWTRGIAILLMPGLHLGFALCINLGPFSYSMALFFVLLIHEQHWRLAYRLLTRSTQRRAVYYDADCGICFLIARVLARMDLLNKLELKPNSGELPAGIAAERAQATLIVKNLATGKVYVRAAAVAQTLRGLPLGFLPALVLQIPGLHLVWNALYDIVASNRTSISAFVGLRACGLPAPEHAAAAVFEQPSPAAQVRGRVTVALRELSILIVVLACVGELLNANGAVPHALRVEQPKQLRVLMDYVRLYQGWRMFAPEAPPHDMHVVVEATTIDGRVVDPYNEVASRTAGTSLKAIPKRLQNDQYFTTYSLFIPEARFRPYLTAFEQWVMRYHERTGRPKDRVVRFVAYKLTDESPPLGETEPRNFKRIAFLRHPK
jgi:predicted DCC family thiol-disulfide oxidoreductase YuxK